MLIRVQSPDGTKRIACEPNESTEIFIKKVQNEFNLPDLFGFYVYKDRAKKNLIPALERKTLSQYGVKHGDMLYIGMNSDEPIAGTSYSNHQHTYGNSFLTNNGVTNIVEDNVDIELFKQNGLIERLPDAKLCRHGTNAKCVHCAPIEPFDESYLREREIKHMSFHTYLKKITGGIDKGKFALLENISCRIKSGCTEHEPWPKGICTKCQPNAITLNRQIYRHVDNVMFENPSIVETFLEYWRKTGHQRIGFLYGYYEIHRDVPLGIRATVVAIYEPPQESTRDFVKLVLPDPNASTVDFIAERLGIKRVGWIFTDLIPDDVQKGTVKNLRNANSYFLTSQECIMAGYLQNAHPNPCHLSPNDKFGSKFVTICVTGDVTNQVHMEGYQVSNQCMALVEDNCLLPTKDAPELGYVKESSAKQYIPDVFYKKKDEYGNEVTCIARPLPIEYLLLDVTVSTPIAPQFTFNPLRKLNPFVIENRLLEGHIQDSNALITYMKQFDTEKFLEAMTDFHVLLYIASMETFPLRDAMEPLLMAIKSKNRELANEWAHSEQWATAEQIIAESNAGSAQNYNTNNNIAGGPNQMSYDHIPMGLAPPWSCTYCTFQNIGTSQTCEMCSLPRSQ